MAASAASLLPGEIMEDAIGNDLEQGDVVMVPCRVTRVGLHRGYWNLSLRTLIANFPDDAGHVFHTTSDRVIRANPGDPGGPLRASLETGVVRKAR